MIKVNGIPDSSNKGLMIGNSSLGALVFGAEYLSFSLDKIDLWDERKPKEFFDPSFTYQNLVKLFKEDYQKAYDLFDKCYLHPYPTKINAGLIKTNIKVSSSDEGIIDTENGIITYKSQDTTIKGYVDANKDVIVIKSNKKFDFNIEFPTYFYKSIKEGGLNYKKPNYIDDGDFLIANQPMYKSKSFSVVIYKKENDLFITIAKNINIERCKNLLLDYSSNIEKYKAKHLKTISNFNKQSSINTPDEEINNLYNLGKYFFYSNSNKKYPVTLQGVWTDFNKDKLPPWKSDLHNDLNVQISYEPFFKTGHYKQSKTLLNYLIKNKNTLKNNAKKFLKTDGLYIPGVMTQSGDPLGGWPQYALSLCCQIWLINIFDLYYQYSNDTSYLKETIYPFFVDLEKSLAKHLKEDEENKLVLEFHSSPEYFENEKKSLFEYQTNFEINCLKYLYMKLVSYSKILNLDYINYQNKLDKIRPLYKNNKNETLISKDVEFDISHRHFSHILYYKNLPVLDFYNHKEELNNDLNVIYNQKTNNWVGFSFTEYAGFLSLINKGEEAYKFLKIFTNNFTHSNGFHMNNDFKEHKYSKMDCYVFTLEANFSYISALNDMLLQNYENKVTIFPAIPNEFKQKGVSFKDLRIHQGHKVSASIKNNKVNFAIKLNSPSTIKLENNFMDNPTLIVDNKRVYCDSKIGEWINIYATKNIIFK